MNHFFGVRGCVLHSRNETKPVVPYVLLYEKIYKIARATVAAQHRSLYYIISTYIRQEKK